MIRAQNLALGELHVDDQPAILDGDQFFERDDAGFDIDGDFGDLHAADAFVGETFGFAFVAGLRAALRDGHWPHGPAGLFPGDLVVRFINLAN